MSTLLRLRTRDLVIALAMAAAVGGMACKRRPHVEGTVATETITKAWTIDGFDTTAVVNVEAEPWSAGACYQGLVSGVDVLVCEYSSDEALALGEQRINAIWDDESVATAAVARTSQPSRTILAVADRAHADPNGRTLSRLIKIFQQQK
jgi:hypothetical protein